MGWDGRIPVDEVEVYRTDSTGWQVMRQQPGAGNQRMPPGSGPPPYKAATKPVGDCRDKAEPVAGTN